jgi:multimeric flavodoxin WrbA
MLPSRTESQRRPASLHVIWHSQTGGTAAMVDALLDGTSTATEVRALARRADDADADFALQADLLVFATPENLAAVSGRMKDWFDRCYYTLLDRCNGKPYALMVCAGSDGSNAVRQIERIATGLRLRQVAEPLLVITSAQTPEAILAPKQIAADELARCRELGAGLAAGLAMGIY